MWTSSLGVGLQASGVKSDGRGGYARKHLEDHVCCLVGGQEGPGFEKRSEKYINKIRPLDIATYPGLKTGSLLGGYWDKEIPLKFVKNTAPARIPSGVFEGKTIPELVRGYTASPFAAVIYNSNNRTYLHQGFSVELAYKMLLAEIRMVFEGSDLEAVFISTIFPRREDIDSQGRVVTNIEALNNLLLNNDRRSENPITIHDSQGREKFLKWVPVDMTDVLPYEGMRSRKYFCKTRRPDFIHVNATILETFYRKLDKCIYRYKNNRRRHK